MENATGESVLLYVDAKKAGLLGPRSAAGFDVGESAGPRTALRAVAPSREWTTVVEGPPWEFVWRIR